MSCEIWSLRVSIRIIELQELCEAVAGHAARARPAHQHVCERGAARGAGARPAPAAPSPAPPLRRYQVVRRPRVRAVVQLVY